MQLSRHHVVNEKMEDFLYSFEGNINVVYDDIVDRSTFSQESDKEEVRRSQFLGASSGVGAYDDPKNPPSDLEVQIRSGKLDKAEVSEIIKHKQQEIKKAQSDFEAAQKETELKKISEARQEYMDKVIGFDGSKKTDTPVES